MLQTKQIVEYIKASQNTVRPVSIRRFANAIGMNEGLLCDIINNKARRGSVPRMQEPHLLRATELIQMLEEHNWSTINQ